MNLTTTKTKTATVALILALIATMFGTFFSVANAASDINTYAFLAFSPNPIGVGQTLTVNMWLSANPPVAYGVLAWDGFTLTITKPDGTSDVMGPYTSDHTGSKYVLYVPEKAGTYSLQFSFAGQLIADAGLNYKPSTSQKLTLTVQDEPIPEYPGTALPTDYWKRPIEAENREWASISGNWLCGSLMDGFGGYNTTSEWNPYSTAPKTAHIVWAKPAYQGGLVGGDKQSISYVTSLGAEAGYSSPAPIIMNGKYYYNGADGKFHCLELRTGEELWAQTGSINVGQLYYFSNIQQFGVCSYLWSLSDTSFKMYDAFTGNLITTMENSSAPWTANSVGFCGPAVKLSTDPAYRTGEPKGELLVYGVDSAKSTVWMWNSSLAIIGPEPELLMATWNPPATLDWQRGIQYNVSVPVVRGPHGELPVLAGAYGNQGLYDDILLASTGDFLSPTDNITDVAYDLKTGQQLWVKQRGHILSFDNSFNRYGPIGDGVYTQFVKEEMAWYGYDIRTGQQLWGPTEPFNASAWSMYDYDGSIAYGKFIAMSHDGHVRAYDIRTGKLLWDFTSRNSGLEAYGFSNYPMAIDAGTAIADNIIFQSAGKFYQYVPIWRGNRLYAINATTGEEVWSILGYMQYPAIADGYLMSLNQYDGQLYCFGKGQTAMTVSAPETLQPFNTSVLIKGTVTDQSPGTQITGSAAISDECMSAWMEYKYMQKPRPTNATGVEVVISVLDPNNNCYEVDRATSDASGFFSCAFTPEVPGKYTVIATFEGSESYYRSFAETAINVEEAPVATPAPTPVPQAPVETYFTVSTIAIIVAIAVAVVLLLRKH